MPIRSKELKDVMQGSHKSPPKPHDTAIFTWTTAGDCEYPSELTRLLGAKGRVIITFAKVHGKHAVYDLDVLFDMPLFTLRTGEPIELLYFKQGDFGFAPYRLKDHPRAQSWHVDATIVRARVKVEPGIEAGDEKGYDSSSSSSLEG